MKTEKKLILIAILIFNTIQIFGQLGINSTGASPANNAMLDISSNSKGLLIPRLTTAQRNVLTATATDGLTVYDTDAKSFWYYNSGTAAWTVLATGGPWLTSGTNIYNGNTGNVGIGSNNPTGKLYIESAGITSGTVSDPNAHLKQRLTNNSNYLWNRFENADGSKNFSHRYDFFSNTSTNYSIFYNSTRLFFINSDGKVGIGPNAPSYSLDVAGDVNLTGQLRVIGDAGTSGEILKKDASNNLSWQPSLIGFRAQGTSPAVSNEQWIPANTDTKVIILNNEQYDTNSMYNPITGDITINSAGIYHIDLKLHLASADAGGHTLTIERQTTGGGGIYSTILYNRHEITTTNTDLPMAISADIEFFPGDLVRIMYRHTCAGNQFITGSFFSWVNMHKLN
jgi:hypothetical protein